MDELYLPACIAGKIGGETLVPEGIGRSGAKVFLLESMVLKIERDCEEARRERDSLLWLRGKLPVPRLYGHRVEEGISYLLMERLPGRMACSDENLSPENASATLKLLADALHMMKSVDISACPLQNRLADKLKRAEQRVAEGKVDTGDWEADNSFSSPQTLLHYLQENRPEEQPVFTHGDFCLPNVFIHQGSIAGFIDLGRAGVADWYQDLALCVRSAEYNFRLAGLTRVSEKLIGYLGIKPDPEKIRYYRLLDELF